MVDWPTNVPSRPKEDTWGIMFPDPLKTEMEGGNVRLRARAGDNYVIISQEIALETMTEWEDFWTFYWTNRTSRFQMEVFLGSGSYEEKTVQFEETPKPVHRAAYVGIAVTLRVFNAKPV
jgi:hypothetical protein